MSQPLIIVVGMGVHAATVTIAGTVGGGSPNLETTAIVEHFWQLYRQPSNNFEQEIIVRS